MINLVIAQLTIVIAAAFAGTALYVSLCEHPARLQLDDKAMLTQWKPSYKHGAIMQASLALVGSVLGAVTWRITGGWLWFAGAIALILPWPWTLFVIKPTNDALLATSVAKAGRKSRSLIERWGRLHWVRTALGVVAAALFFFASIR